MKQGSSQNGPLPHLTAAGESPGVRALATRTKITVWWPFGGRIVKPCL